MSVISYLLGATKWPYYATKVLWDRLCLFIFGMDVKVVKWTKFEKAYLVEGNEEFRLLRDGDWLVAIYHDERTDNNFQVFSMAGEEAALSRFRELEFKLPKLAKCRNQAISPVFLKETIELIDRHPGYGIAHLLVHRGMGRCVGRESVARQINLPDLDSGKLPLHVAIDVDNDSMVEQLLELGASGSEKDKDGWTALHYAATCPRPKIIEILASKDGSYVNEMDSRGETALHAACTRRLAANVAALLGHNADPAISRSDRCPIHCAVTADSVEIVEMLAIRDPEGSTRSLDGSGNSVAHLFTGAKVLDVLVRYGCNLESRNQLGETPLMTKIKGADFNSSLALVVRGADPSARSSRDGNTPLHFAIELDRADLVELLIAFGAEPNTHNDLGVSPRHKAAGSLKPNRDLILQYLHYVGAKRCTTSMRECSMGCAHGAKFNGAQLLRTSFVNDDMNFWNDNERVNEVLSAVNQSLSERTPKGETILTLDGGGVRGVVTIAILMAIEKEAGRPIHELFDVIGGTSTGGLLAMGIAYKKSLSNILSIYFRLKNEVFCGKRPYNPDNFERYLKEEFGGNSKMMSIQHPKVMIMTVLADRSPTELFIFKNYNVPGSQEHYPTTDSRLEPVPEPKDQLIWQALRATTAATTYFKPSGRFIDGAFIANNPTLDVLAEMYRINRLNEVFKNIKPKPIDLVLSVGTGRSAPRQVEVCDISRPGGIKELSKTVSSVLNVGELLVDQVTNTDGHVTRRTIAWCSMLGIPFFRLNPILAKYVSLDTTDDMGMIATMREARYFIHRNREVVAEIGRLLSRRPRAHQAKT